MDMLPRKYYGGIIMLLLTDPMEWLIKLMHIIQISPSVGAKCQPKHLVNLSVPPFDLQLPCGPIRRLRLSRSIRPS